MKHIPILDLKEKHNMDVEQFAMVKKLLEEIRDLLKEQQTNQQPTTKITVVGNKAQTQTPKGLKSTEDFQF
jgi:hypothetical protein